jgi:hypothetical protein
MLGDVLGSDLGEGLPSLALCECTPAGSPPGRDRINPLPDERPVLARLVPGLSQGSGRKSPQPHLPPPAKRRDAKHPASGPGFRDLQ